MAAESIGSVAVTITGDPSQLYASFGAAQAAARTAGANIASGLTGAMAPALAATTGLVDQFGRSIQSTSAPTREMATEAVRVAAAQAGFARSTEASSAALGHQVSQIQATSGALRTLSGEGGIRAAERFIASIPGVGAALQGAFPLIGILALIELIDRATAHFGKTSEAAKEFAESLKQADAEAKHLSEEIQRTDLEIFGQQFGETAKLAKQAADAIAGIEAQTHRAALAMAEYQLQEALHKGEVEKGVPVAEGITAGAPSAETQNAITLARKELANAQLQVEEDQKKSRELSGKSNELAATQRQGQLNQDIEDWNELVRENHKAFDELERLQRERMESEAHAAEQQKAQWDATQAEHQRFVDFEQSLNAKEIEGVDKTNKELGRFVEDSLKQVARLREIREGAAGASAATGADAKKLALERDYSLQLGHTGAQQLSQARELAAIDVQKHADEEAALQAKAREASLAGDAIRAAEYTAEAEKKRAEYANQDYAAQTKILDLQKQQSLAGQLSAKGVGRGAGSITDQTTASEANLIASSVNNISSGLANAVVHGKNLSQAFRDIAKQLASQALGDILKIGLNAALASLQALIPAFGAVASAQGAAAAAKATTSATDFGEAEGNIAVAATGAAAAVAWIPIVGPALAAAAAAAMEGSLQPYAALAAFAQGGSPPVGVPSLVGEKGPELFIPHQSGTIVPNHMLKGYADGAGLSALRGGGSTHFHGDIHVHGARDAQQTAQKLPYYLKSRFSGFSPASSTS